MLKALRFAVQFLKFTVVLCLLSSCLQKEIKKTTKEKTVRPTVSGVPIPVLLWDEIEEVYIEPETESHLEKLEVKTTKEEETESIVEEKPKDIPIKYMPITVHLLDGNQGTLAAINHVLKYGQGGGSLDFADYVLLKEGSFRLRIDLPERSEEMERFKVFFWPNGRQRKIDSEILGSDCRKVLDLTDLYDKVLQKEGLRVVANRQKYITLLAGTYVFALKQSNTLYLAQLTIEDSRYKLLHCRQ